MLDGAGLPELLEDFDVFIGDGAALVEIGGAEGGEFLPQPSTIPSFHLSE